MCRFSRSRLLRTILFASAPFAVCLPLLPAIAALPAADCNASLDESVALYNGGNTDAALELLQSIEADCNDLPQIHHNLGVIAGNEGQWQSAIKYFRRSIDGDARAAMTVQHLQDVHQYNASRAYAKALDTDDLVRASNAPELRMQTSHSVNADGRRDGAARGQLHTVGTLDYELYAWWNAAADQDNESWLAHYVRGYPPLVNNDPLQVDWANVERDITFTAQDAVVLLRYTAGSVENRTLLILRLQDNRWKIYRETVL